MTSTDGLFAVVVVVFVVVCFYQVAYLLCSCLLGGRREVLECLTSTVYRRSHEVTVSDVHVHTPITITDGVSTSLVTS